MISFAVLSCIDLRGLHYWLPANFPTVARPASRFPIPNTSTITTCRTIAARLLLIDIMSTTCPHCQLLTTTLEKVKARYGDKVAILEVVLPPDNQTHDFPSTADVNKVTVPMICDMGQMTASYFKADSGDDAAD